MLRFLFDWAITAYIDVQGENKTELSSQIQIFDLSLYVICRCLRRGGVLVGRRNTFTNLTGILLVCPTQTLRYLSSLLKYILLLHIALHKECESIVLITKLQKLAANESH